MDDSYQRLAAEVSAAGGQLQLERRELAVRLGKPIDVRDTYARYILERRLREVGLTAEFHTDGSVSLAGKERTGRIDRPNVATAPEAPGPSPIPSSTLGPAATARPPMDPSPSEGSNPEATPRPTPSDPSVATEPTASQVGNWLYALLVLTTALFPAIGHELFPGGQVGEKQVAFLTIYFAALPLSLAATFICLMLMLDWFEDNRQRLAAAGAAIVVSAVWGIGFGQSSADLNLISQLHGPPHVFLGVLVALALFAHAIYYGPALFIAAWLSSFVAALWIKEKVSQLDKRSS